QTRSTKGFEAVQNAAAKLLTRSFKWSHVTPLLISLHWLPIKFRVQFKVLVFTFRALHGQTPSYIDELLQPHVTSRTLRSSDQGLLSVPQSRLKLKSFCSHGPQTLELPSLPSNLRSLDSVDSFK
ncbi:hypothetical protein LDENG_00109420, partial [Lucifuga dentata]